MENDIYWMSGEKQKRLRAIWKHQKRQSFSYAEQGATYPGMINLVDTDRHKEFM